MKHSYLIFSLLLISVVFISGCTGLNRGQIVCSADAQVCDDGSYVGRVAPSCEFAPCPDNSVTKDNNQTDQNITDTEPVGCPEDAKICDDGTVVVRVPPSCEFEICPDSDDNQEPVQVICTSESRDVDACIEIYQPVCGWFDPAKIQCIKYPCATEYSNSCFACKDSKVLYYTEGECPSG